jgi:hypothetical protein
MVVEHSDLNPVETMEEGLLKAYNEDKSQMGEHAIWEEDTFSVLKGPFATNTDSFWNCDTYHQYSVATTLPHQTADNLKLWKNDILVGFKSSDTIGWEWNELYGRGGGEWGGKNWNYSSAHKIIFSIKHIDEKGRTSYPIYRHTFEGGTANNGVRYISFYPTKIGTYTVTINRVKAAGDCDVPYEGRPNFLSYDLEFGPPDEEDIPDGMDIDIDALADNYAAFLANQKFLKENTSEPVQFAQLAGIAIGITIVSYGLAAYLFK